MAHSILNQDSGNLDSEKLWWRQPNWQEYKESFEGYDGTAESIGSLLKGLKPFVLKMVDRSGYACSHCAWVKKCSGCVIWPEETVIPQFLKKCHIAVEWHSQMIESEYNPISNETMKHETTLESEEADDHVISLDDCLQKFHDVEKLTDKVNCTDCEDQTSHQKSFETFRPPPVLTIQLKRFKNIDGEWKKIQSRVEFPTQNLDLSPYVLNFEFLSKLDISCQYDLCGIINHYGSLTYGHYISIVKNNFEGQWYKYDDQNRIPISEANISKKNAYMLFYVRKDALNKKVNDLVP